MKNFFKLSFLLCVGIMSAQNSEYGVTSNYFEDEMMPINPDLDTEDVASFEKAAKLQAIKQKTVHNIQGTTSGFYAICDVFSKTNNLKSQVRKLNRKGFEAGYFLNPETKLNYLYLKRYDTWQQAFADYNTNFDNRFKNDVWVLQIKNTDDIKEFDAFEETVKVDQKKSANTASESTNILIQKADEFFDKMWYAEAAKYYELALKKYGANYPAAVIQKAGDAHYFNTDIENAYKWYNMLYEKNGDNMTTDNLFKYAHSLKGTDKYKRSKKLMKLYNKRVSEHSTSHKSIENEELLDSLLRMKNLFDVTNLKINSSNSDFSPTYYNENEVVFASSKDSSIFNTRRYKWNNQPFLDLYVSKINEESSELKNAIKFSKKVNTKYHEASATFSPDNETMYFTRNNYGKKLKRGKNGINHLKIYRSKKVDGEWTEATEVSFNSDEYSTGHPALSEDGKQLYFVSDMPGSIGETDLFVVDVFEDGTFSKPRNLGPEINTKQKEMFPFVNDKKLYFSSNGHVGLGGLDVYEVAFDDEDAFLEVRNLGKPINSKKDDFSFIVNEETQKGYFASNRQGGKGDDDIYSFERLEIKEVPKSKNAIAGVVTELITGDLMPNALITLLDENHIKLKEMETDETGSFVFEDLASGKRYFLKLSKEGYYDDEIESTTRLNELVNADFSLRKLNELIQVENGIKKLKTEMIYFDFDTSFIKDDAAAELDKLVVAMKETPSMIIKIESHTDSRGSAVYNKYLSDKRAKSTRNYIISKGISPERIESAIGYGEDKLLNDCDGTVACTEKQHYLNRRSELIIVKM